MTTITDSEAMKHAKTAMRSAKMPFRQTSPHQIKHGRLNFYPDRGTIFRDGDRAKLEEQGIVAFMQMCGYPKENRGIIEL
jgi:hypothetical protein